MRNSCKECDFYHPTNNTCQSKKCCTGGAGYVTFFDRLFCKPYKAEKADMESETNRRTLNGIKSGKGLPPIKMEEKR